MFVGRMTHAANHHELHDGSVARDSNGVAAKRWSRKKAKKVKVGQSPSRITFSSRDGRQAWIASWRARQRKEPEIDKGNLVARNSGARLQRARRELQQADDMAYWRQCREQRLRPRAPLDRGSSASGAERLRALTARVAEKGDAVRRA